MSASRERKQRQTLAGLSEKEKKAAIEAKKTHQKHVLWGVLGGVAAVAVVALLVWDNGVIQKNLTAYTVADHKYTVADVDYFYYSEYNSYYSTYGSYLFQDGVSLKEQTAYTDDDGNEVTWHNLLIDDAKASLESMTVLYDLAQEAGYTISEDGAAEVQEAIDSISTFAANYSVTEEYYMEYLYGPYMTKNRLEKLLTMYTTASEYSELKSDEFVDAITDDEVQSYYTENADDLDSYYYHVYYVNGSAESTTDADGNTVEPTEEETEAAMSAASDTADEVKAAVEAEDTDAIDELVNAEDSKVSDNGDYLDVLGSSVSSIYGDFLKDASRQAGDVEVVESTSGYYVVRFDSRQLDEYHPATYRDIFVKAETDEDADAPTEEQLSAAETTANSILQLATSEDTFTDQVAANSSDDDTKDNGGLNESATKSGTSDENIKAWLFDESRSEGDTAIVEAADGTGYYVLYFVSYDEKAYWQQTATNSLANDDYDEWYEGVSADISGTTGAGFGLVGKD